jgi:hypothetical protein
MPIPLDTLGKLDLPRTSQRVAYNTRGPSL